MPLNRKKNDQYISGCAGKVQHKTRLSAEYYLENINSEKAADIYECTICGFFHIGTRKAKKSKKGKVNKSKLFNDGKIKIRKFKY